MARPRLLQHDPCDLSAGGGRVAPARRTRLGFRLMKTWKEEEEEGRVLRLAQIVLQVIQLRCLVDTLLPGGLIAFSIICKSSERRNNRSYREGGLLTPVSEGHNVEKRVPPSRGQFGKRGHTETRKKKKRRAYRLSCIVCLSGA